MRIVGFRIGKGSDINGEAVYEGGLMSVLQPRTPIICAHQCCFVSILTVVIEKLPPGTEIVNVLQPHGEVLLFDMTFYSQNTESSLGYLAKSRSRAMQEMISVLLCVGVCKAKNVS